MSGLDEKLARLRLAYAQRMTDEWDFEMSCGRLWTSPIEKLFVAGLLTMSGNGNFGPWEFPHGLQLGHGIQWLLDQGIKEDDARHGIGFLVFENPDVLMYAQLPVRLSDRTAVIDYAFITPWGRFAVELDGHDFHERTKEQAERDKSRDRGLTAAGWQPIRFTGSEVWRDPAGCAKQVSDQIYAALRREVNSL